MSYSAGATGGGNGGGTPAVSTSVIVPAEEIVTVSHVLKVDVSSRTKGLGIGEYIMSSGIFDAGGHSWSIKYYPDGEAPELADWISINLYHDQTDALYVRTQFKITLLEKQTGQPVPSFSVNEHMNCGFKQFIKRKTFEESTCLQDDCFRIKCDVTVKKEIKTEAGRKLVTVLPSDIQHHLGNFLSSEEEADVTFEVEGDTISAHRLVLAARSPVFKAELFGPMKERTMSHIRIVDMEARVFKAMLHFVYTDTLPEMDKDDKMVMAQHLLVAADRYGLERLKLVCEEMLCSYINASTAATTLVLAEQHGCEGLKKACFMFLEKPSNFKTILGTDGFEHLSRSCPSVLKDLLVKIVP